MWQVACCHCEMVVQEKSEEGAGEANDHSRTLFQDGHGRDAASFELWYS